MKEIHVTFAGIEKALREMGYRKAFKESIKSLGGLFFWLGLEITLQIAILLPKGPWLRPFYKSSIYLMKKLKKLGWPFDIPQ